MNFLEICQMIFDLADRAPYKIETTRLGPNADLDEQIIKIVGFAKRGYQNIQSWNRHFTFHHTSGTFITTEDDGTTDYTVSNVRSFFQDSFKIHEQGQTAEWPLIYLTYKEWRDAMNLTQFQDGPPTWITQLPDRSFRLTPGPDKVYIVEADWHIFADVLEDDEDEPIWDQDLHELVVYEALKLYTTEFEVPENTVALIAEVHPRLKTEFKLRYLPDWEISGGFA